MMNYENQIVIERYVTTSDTVLQIAESTDHSYYDVRRILDDAGVVIDRTRGQKNADVDINEATYLYVHKELSLEEVAFMMEINKRTLRKYLKRSGVTIRPRGRTRSWSPKAVCAMREIIDAGEQTVADLARSNGVSRQRIQQLLAAA